MKIFLVIKCSYSLAPPLEIYTKKMISKEKKINFIDYWRNLISNLHFHHGPTGSFTPQPQHNPFSTQQLEWPLFFCSGPSDGSCSQGKRPSPSVGLQSPMWPLCPCGIPSVTPPLLLPIQPWGLLTVPYTWLQGLCSWSSPCLGSLLQTHVGLLPLLFNLALLSSCQWGLPWPTQFKTSICTLT